MNYDHYNDLPNSELIDWLMESMPTDDTRPSQSTVAAAIVILRRSVSVLFQDMVIDYARRAITSAR